MTAEQLPTDCDARTRRLCAYWQSIRPGTDRLPGRRNFEPTDLPELLRWLWLMDVVRPPPRFRCRLFGTGHREIIGRDFTGNWLDEAFPHFAASRTHADFVAALSGEPCWYRGAADYITTKGYIGIERLVLPLAADGATVDMLLGLTLYTREDGRAA